MLFSIPFAFWVPQSTTLGRSEDIRLEAGTYRIELMHPNQLVISSATGAVVARVECSRGCRRMRKAAALASFHQYGVTYVLHEFWSERSLEGYRVPETLFEMELGEFAGPATVFARPVRKAHPYDALQETRPARLAS